MTKPRFAVRLLSVLGVLFVALAGLGAQTLWADGRFAIRLSGGVGYHELGELNSGIKGAMDSTWATYSGTLLGGSTYNELKLGTTFAVDAIFYLMPKFGIGIGAEYIRGHQTSGYAWDGPNAGTVSAEPLLTAVPLKVGLFFRFPLSKRLTLTANVGAGYYQAKLDHGYEWMITGIVSDRTQRIQVSAWKPGAHGGLGLEYALGARLAVFFEALGRIAKVKGLKGTMEFNQSGAVPATLYYFEQRVGTTWYPILDAPYNRPIPSLDIRFVNEATIDLTGATALIGFVIRF